MMSRQVARQFWRLGEVHSWVYGRRASGENGRKLTASTRVGSESRLMDYPASNCNWNCHMEKVVLACSDPDNL
jgi:hypothetical protein